MSVGTTTTSKVRAVVTALYTALVTRPGLTGVQVFRYAPNQTAIQGREYVALATTITGEQSYPFAGNSVKQDDFTLSGEIWTAIPLAGDDAADAGWFRRDELPSDLSRLESLEAIRAWATDSLAEERIQGMGRVAESRLVCIEELAVISADQTRRLKVITESAEKVASQNSVMLAALERSTDPEMQAMATKIRRGES